MACGVKSPRSGGYVGIRGDAIARASVGVANGGGHVVIHGKTGVFFKKVGVVKGSGRMICSNYGTVVGMFVGKGKYGVAIKENSLVSRDADVMLVKRNGHIRVNRRYVFTRGIRV